MTEQERYSHVQALSLSLGLVILVPGCAAYAEELTSEKLVEQVSTVDSQKAIRFDENELNRINAELEILDLQKKPDWQDYWKKLQQRQQLLNSFIREKQPVGKSRTELYAILGKPLKYWEISTSKSARAELFSISDGMKAKPNPIRMSMALEVSFLDDVSSSYQIVIKQSLTGKNIRDLSERLNESFFALEKRVHRAYEYPLNVGAIWRENVEVLLQATIESDADAQKIPVSTIGQTCWVSFRVARDGRVRDILITRSSLSDRFDNLIVSTLNRLSGKKFLQFGEEFEVSTIAFSTNFALSDKKSANAKDSDYGPYDSF